MLCALVGVRTVCLVCIVVGNNSYNFLHNNYIGKAKGKPGGGMSTLLQMSGVAAQAVAHTATASWDLYETIQAFFQAPSYHLLFEAALIIWIIGLIFTKSYNSKTDKAQLSQKEKDELVAEWQPDSLVPELTADDHILLSDMQRRVIDSKIGKYVTINGRSCLNMATFNFLGIIGRSDVEEEAVKSLRKYGVGSCGPRGFYGTLDVHLSLETQLAEWMHCEEAIIYSYGFATIASAIPAYAKRGDVIFCDRGVAFAIQKGVLASRSKVHFFLHNDMVDLERLLQQQAEDELKNPKKAKVTRKFLLVEGLYLNYGDLCPLPQLVALRQKYKVRIFMDESFSFGTLGKTGRGVTEHFGVSVDEIDLLAASLENSLASCGGFCCGKSYVIDHQRLSGLGYCFSASTPPMLSQAASVALHLLDKSPGMLSKLRENCKYTYQKLQSVPQLKVVGDAVSPVLHLLWAAGGSDRQQDKATLRYIVRQCEEQEVALTLASYLEQEERFLPPPSIRLSINCELTSDDIDRVISVIAAVCNKL